jgi:hypothetical protein
MTALRYGRVSNTCKFGEDVGSGMATSSSRTMFSKMSGFENRETLFIRGLEKNGNVRRLVCIASAHDRADLRKALHILHANKPDGCVGTFNPPIREFVQKWETPWELLGAGFD